MPSIHRKSSNTVILLLCGLATFFDGFDLQLLALAVPGMAVSFHVAPQAFAPALAATIAGAALGAIGLAPMADVRGRRPVLIFAMLLIAVPSAVIAAADASAVVIAMRFVTGIALGAVIPIAIAFASEAATGRYRNVAIASVTVASALGAAAASIAAPMVEQWGGWRWLFVVGAIAPLIAAILFYLFCPSTTSRGAAPRWQSPASLFRPPTRRLSIALFILFPATLLASSGMISWLPVLLIDAGWSRPEAQRAVALLGIGGIMGSLLLGWLSARLSVTIVLATAYAVAILAALGCLLTLDQSPSTTLAILVIGIGMHGTLPVVGAVSATLYPNELRATGMGWSSGIGRVVAIGGPLLFGAMIDADFRPGQIIAFVALPLGLCLVTAVTLFRGNQPRTSTDDSGKASTSIATRSSDASVASRTPSTSPPR